MVPNTSSHSLRSFFDDAMRWVGPSIRRSAWGLCAALCLAFPASARPLLNCPLADPKEPRLVMTCADVQSAQHVAEVFGAAFGYHHSQCQKLTPSDMVQVPRRQFCEASNRVIRALDTAASRGQTAAVAADWEQRVAQLLESSEALTAKYHEHVQNRLAQQKKEREALIGPRKNDTASAERFFSHWNNNVNIPDRKRAVLAAWWKSMPANTTANPDAAAITTCVDWTWLAQRAPVQPQWKPAVMLLEPLFEHCYANLLGVAVVPLAKANAVFDELAHAPGLQKGEAAIWKKGFFGASADNYAMLAPIAEARLEQQRWDALSPAQKQQMQEQQRAAGRDALARNCAMYEAAYKLAYQAGDIKRATSALNAMSTVGCPGS